VGPAGRDGRDGQDGLDCIECAKGPIGPKGNDGKAGLSGKQGIQGKSGPQGIKGGKGNSGVKGTKGTVGTKGDKGDKGVCDKSILDTMLKDIFTLKKTVDRLSGMLDVANNKIKQSYLPAGYDKYSLYDIQWQSLHMAAAAACRGSTPTGGSGPSANSVYPRKHGTNCKTLCSQTKHKNCDAEVSLHGLMHKSTNNLKHVGYYYNYGCNTGYTWGDEAKLSKEQVGHEILYTSYCCCRA